MLDFFKAFLIILCLRLIKQFLFDFLPTLYRQIKHEKWIKKQNDTTKTNNRRSQLKYFNNINTTQDFRPDIYVDEDALLEEAIYYAEDEYNFFNNDK